ncbi:ATP-dependent protease ATPase subunit HslU [uncultured Dialister sp.]|jgi:ATP-dependent HslUV protease ATP-binding subunit HslU|uniref:ATP-dependent protease ATPase subunit HslU n=1 Tax=uncultured Dialister sp. TaxID=278064 RepID=UPI00263076B7|nr:ATP-dependent protease ATPase subunit HslU [uncultured Dialister sp.]
MEELTPRKIVEYLDHYIIGQKDAKRAVAVALRNRWRAGQLSPELAKEISPKNILLIGPTGVGKTEIARRIASLTHAPFVKVEATKYTEVGYVGRDVESMVRDLVEEAVRLVKKEESASHGRDAEEEALRRIAEALWPSKKPETRSPMDIIFGEKQADKPEDEGEKQRRKELIERIRSGELDEREIEIKVEDKGSTPQSDNEQANQISIMIAGMMPKKMKKKKVTVRAAKKILMEEAADEMVDMEVVKDRAIHYAEERGIIFIDEIDKIAGRTGSSGGPDVSREGVQRDILPIVEGATVKTKYGQVKTDHILFMAAGAFHVSKPSDLIPELQGRFPIRVELSSLTKEDLRKILTEPRQALIRQYTALLETEGLHVSFSEDALDTIAEIASDVNSETEDIGARRLYTILERVLEDLSFDAPDMEEKEMVVDSAYVRDKLGRIRENIDISNYIL